MLLPFRPTVSQAGPCPGNMDDVSTLVARSLKAEHYVQGFMFMFNYMLNLTIPDVKMTANQNKQCSTRLHVSFSCVEKESP